MENTKNIYFKSNKKFLKYALLKEHEWYLYCFQKKLRAEEKAGNIVSKFIYRMSKNRLGAKLGIYIPAGVFDEGLHIWHYGNIIVNAESKVGKNCMLHGDNCIGNNGKTTGCPIIGDNVDIGTGAKVLFKLPMGLRLMHSLTLPRVMAQRDLPILQSMKMEQ